MKRDRISFLTNFLPIRNFDEADLALCFTKQLQTLNWATTKFCITVPAMIENRFQQTVGYYSSVQLYHLQVHLWDVNGHVGTV